MKKILYALMKSTLSEKRSLKSSKSSAGFTLVEMLVVVFIIGILSAIAAPTWDSLTTRQRLRSVNNQVFQALKTAQAEAKRTKQDVKLEFFTGTTTEAPKYTLSIAPNTPVYLNVDGQVKPGIIKIYTVNTTSPGTPVSEIKFDHLGTTKNAGFTVVTYLNNSKTTRKCAVVETILGTVRAVDGTACPTPP